MRAALEGTWDDKLSREVQAFWDERAGIWSEGMGPHHAVPLIDAVERLDAPPARALELGMGTGLGTRPLAAALPEATVVGVDLSVGMLHQARREGSAGPVAAADSHDLPFTDDAVDLVVLLNTYLFASEVLRVLAPGGTVIGAWTIGPATPIFVTPEQAEEALGGEAVIAEAAWGTWWRISFRQTS